MSNVCLPRELVEQVLSAMTAAHDESLDGRHFSGRQILLIHSIVLNEALSQSVTDSHQQEHQSKPLTDEQIYECERLATIRHHRHMHSIRGQQITPADDLNWHFARAIEAAHGIGVTN